MSFNTARRSKNRNLNSNNYGTSKIDKQNKMKNINDKNQGANRYEGVYSNPDFMYANTSLIGTLANIVHKDGHIYEGIFNTFSSDFEIVLNTVSKVVPKAETNNVSPNVGSLLASLTAHNDFLDTVIFKLKDIVMMSIPNVNLDFAIKGNFTDTEISKFNPNILANEKDLVPWDCNDDGDVEDININNNNNDLMLNNEDGWNADDMFKLNEAKYNLATTYTESMEGYTVPLDKNADDYKAREAEANRIAQLIENDAASKDRLAKEDGDEEDKFSAVQRPVITEQQIQATLKQSQTNFNQNNNNSTPINQPHSRHDNMNNSINRNRNKNQNTSSGNLSSTSNSFNNRSKNQSINTSGSNLQQQQQQQQQQSAYNFKRSNNGPMHNRLNTRLDQQQQPYNHQNDKDHHRNENRLLHNDQQLSSSQPQPLPQRSHNSTAANNRRPTFQPQQQLPIQSQAVPMQKREETTHDLKKFSSGFKLAINQQGNSPPQQGNQQQQLDNKENINKDLADRAKQLNLNKNVKENKTEPQVSSTSTSNKSLNKITKEEEISQISKPVNKPLIDKPPISKDKLMSSSTDKLNNEQSTIITPTTDKVNNNKQNKEPQNKSAVESPTIVESSQANEDNKSEINNESIKTNVETSSQTSDSGKGSSNASTESTVDKALKKSTLNPNAKKFVFNPKANPYTPKTYVAPSYSNSPVVNQTTANLPNTINPQQLAFQPHHLPHPNAMHGGQPPNNSVHPAGIQQMQISQLGTVQHAGNQQLVTPVLHQQPLMAHHPGQVHMQTGAHQMLPFPHIMSPQSIQFVTNPQNLNHPHSHQNVHHTHQASPYTIIPASAVPVSTASLSNAQLQNNASAIVNYGGQPVNTGQQSNQQPQSINVNQSQQQQTGQQGGGQNTNQRSNRSKPGGQYHNQNTNSNQRSNPNNQQQTNQVVQQVSNQPPQQMQNPHVVNQSNPAAVYSQQIHHLPPNFSAAGPNVSVNGPGTYPIYHNPHFQPHHNPHTRLMSPQGLSMVHPGMTAYTPDQAAIQQFNLTYMTNMPGMHHQFVAVQQQPPQSNSATPVSVQSPVPIHQMAGSNNVQLNNNIQQPPTVSTPNQQSQRSTTSQQSSNSQSSSPQQQIITTNNGAVTSSYANTPMMPFIIAQPPSLHLTGIQQTNDQQVIHQ